MLHFIKDLSNKLLDFIKDDPVRPEIPTEFRVKDGRMVAGRISSHRSRGKVNRENQCRRRSEGLA